MPRRHGIVIVHWVVGACSSCHTIFRQWRWTFSLAFLAQVSPVSLSLADSISLVESVAGEVEGIEVAFDGGCGPLF
jgi:hypothetical protein